MNSRSIDRMLCSLFMVAVCKFSVFVSFAQAHDLTSYVGVEFRGFLHSPLLPEQTKHNASFSLYTEYYHDFDNRAQRIALTGFARVDSADSERSHADIRELYWWQNFDGFEVYAGLRKIFWGVTESVHLVDVINQTDNLENIDGEDKLGQPMVQLVMAKDWGTLSAFVLPYFREREFLGRESRLRPALPIRDDAVYHSGAEESHVDVALRWSHYIDIWDIGLSHFSGTQRDPVFEAVDSPTDGVQLRPIYSQIHQSGLDIQATIDAWLLKLEMISIEEKSWGRNTAAASGFEYTFFGVADSNADLGVVLEYQFDDRSGARQRVAQNDIVAGLRWAFNDLDGSSLLVLVGQDLEHNNRFFSLEMDRRMTDKWKFEVQARFFSSIEENTPEYSTREDDYVQLEFRRYF